ncbi:SusC/RagA family TonB-linked outer membrane protein [Pedobacter sp. MC2016-14]|uniref:SusC/RagA family TonB-linked outer membrane protein n=1 Tax=Pedobacter sp. MC2016-14 TaxID=2897327 RepID=UPI001E309240|nr:SusC/RagA family TonB-linked outer membrane protein [Pedobacter sp. MC2016-14]MCD0490488.1 SusC/RagA family TonB-linked outer membrane protein [Pedobacter sp. MC2016-14]
MKLTTLYKPVWRIQHVKSKLLMVMKLTSILLLIGTLHVSATSFSQTVTISRRNTSLETVFKDIKKQTGYLFFYTEKVNITSNYLTVEFKNAPLEEALNACLKNLDLTYDIVNKTIVIRNKVSTVSQANLSLLKNALSLQGKIIDSATKEPIPGVNILLKRDRSVRTQSNSSGEFRIEAQAGDILIYSYIGYKPKEVRVTNDKFLLISLISQVNNMDDVVITGYQTIKKESYTGNAITIKGSDLKQLNPQNVLKSIQAFDPSFRMLDNNLLGSDPNALPRINVRGATALPSITDNVLDRNNLSSSYNLPTFILDGFEVSLQKVSDLDINRIESMTILKDAAATAIYGSRAANGVVVITTKAPLPGKLQLSYNYELNFNGPDLSDYHVLNAADKLQFERISGLYTSASSDPSVKGYNTVGSQNDLDIIYYSKLKNVVSGVNTYWLSQPLQNAFGHKHSINAQGGDAKFRYGLDMRYESNPGVMKGSGRNQYSGGMTFNYNPTPKLLIRNEISLMQVDAENSKYGDFSNYVNMNPYYPMNDENGNVLRQVGTWDVDTHQSGGDQYQQRRVYNPLYEASLGNFDKNSYFEFIDRMEADWKISPSFRLVGLISLNKNLANANKFVSPFSNEYIDGAADQIQNRGRYEYSTDNAWKVDGTIRLLHNKQVKEHSFNTTLVTNVIADRAQNRKFVARGFSSDKFSDISFARTYEENKAPTGAIVENRLLGFAIAENYSWKNKYLLDASFRLDGSSAFASAGRFSPFWSTGIGWNMHNEDFMKALAPVISRLRLTATTGFTGSASVPVNLSKSIYAYQKSNWYSTGVGATVTGYGNESLKWQKTRDYDFTVDLGLFNDRFSIRPGYYYKTTYGLLTDINISPSTGFTVYKANLGDMVNRGYEIYATWNAFKTKDWNINITGNLAHNSNKVIKIYDALDAYNHRVDDVQNDADNKATTIPLLRFKEGQSVNAIYAVKSLGIDPENGKEIFQKLDGSLTYDYDIKDVQVVGEATPKISGSWGSNITYKQFLLSFSFAYEYGGDKYNQTLVDRVENADPRYNVDSRALTEKWTKPGDIAFYKNIADGGVNLDNTRTSSRFVQRYNFINLQSVYLSYDFKKSMARKIGFQTLRPAVTANDVLRFSSIETERGIYYPYSRSVTFSLTATF